MKRKSLLIMLLMAMFAPLAFAQQALPYEYSFEDNDLTADGWTTSDLSNGGIMNLYNSGPHYYVFGFNYTSTPPQYLISPELTGTENGVTVAVHVIPREGRSGGKWNLSVAAQRIGKKIHK